MTDFDEIPIIDVSAIYGNDPKQLRALADEFHRTYATTGFAYIAGHGIEADLVSTIFEASRNFHNLAASEKMAIALDHKHRGFIPINTSTDVNSKLAEVKRPNQSESFMMMREDMVEDSGVFLSGPNQWPNLPGFRETVSSYHDAMTALGQRMIKVISLALGDDNGALSKPFESPTTWLRLLHYPTTSPESGDDLYGSAPHTDFGFLTFLAQDDVGGLQVMTPSGQWIDAPKIEGTFVVNVGDMLSRWSNGVLKSTPHRVINRSGRARYSCPFFFDPNVNTDISPLPSCVGSSGVPNFEPINFADFLRAELGAGYDQHKGSSS